MPRSPVTSQTSSTLTNATEATASSQALTETLHLTSASTVPEQDEDDEEDDDDERILETGHNGRWQKINHQVPRDVPGIDDAYLAMDTEDGVEVVWNEVIYSQTKRTGKGSKERLKNILQGLTSVKHQNIVNFYDFWHDKVNNQDRLVFITEYITSGSLAQFLKKNKRVKGTNAVSDKIWRRWCRQILSALSYLHKFDIIHGNLSLASIFIQHNGLVKIGSVSPDAIHQHVKTKNKEVNTTLHYAAPEYTEGPVKTSADIYAFGICSLEMLNFALLGNGDSPPGLHARGEANEKALESLDPQKREFIRLCLHSDPDIRPKASVLLKHHVLQEVFNLKLLSTYALRGDKYKIQSLDKDLDYSHRAPDEVLAFTVKGGTRINFLASKTPKIEIENFFDDISQDFLLDSALPTDSPAKKDEPGARTVPVSNSSSVDRSSTLYHDPETKRILSATCEVKLHEDNKQELYLKLHFENKMERELRSELTDGDNAGDLATDLVACGLLSAEDRAKITELIVSKLTY